VKLVLNGAQSIRVRAFDPDGKPVPNARIWPSSIKKEGKIVNTFSLGGDRISAATTNEQGIASFGWLPVEYKGGMLFKIHHDDYSCPELVFSKPGDKGEQTARLVRNASVSGKVAFADGKPAGGILVQAEGRGKHHRYSGQARTRPDGSYQMKVHPDQSYIFAVVDEKWAAPSHNKITLQENEQRDDLDFQLSQGTLIHGKITTGADRRPGIGEGAILNQFAGEPAPDQRFRGPWLSHVRRLSVARWTHTDQQGRYSFRVGPGYYELSLGVSLSAAVRPIPITVVAEKEIVRNEHTGEKAKGTLRATVVDTQDQPVAGATVQVKCDTDSGHYEFIAVADSAGRFTVRGWQGKIRFEVRGRDGQIGRSEATENDRTVKIVMGVAGRDLPATSIENLKHIAYAFHQYHQKQKRFPPAVVTGPDGKTPHSWRVALLPYLANQPRKHYQELYEQYRLDEPWDGPNNRKLLDKMPAVYRALQSNADSTNACYFALTGPTTIFSGREGSGFIDIRDGTSNTLLIVEAKRDIPWTKPQDIPYDASKPLPKLGGFDPGGFHAAFADGSAHLLPKSCDKKVLRALFTKQGGERVDRDALIDGPVD